MTEKEKNMKKFLAILLSVVMLLGCVVISTSAAEEPDIYPEAAYDVETGVVNVINAYENANWYENNLEEYLDLIA